MEEVYNALSQAQKHIMLKNGMLEFDTFKPRTCCCNHSVAEHLDFSDLCLSRELCLCDRFIDKEAKITPQKQQKVPKKEEQKQKEQIELDSYIYIWPTTSTNLESNQHCWKIPASRI